MEKGAPRGSERAQGAEPGSGVHIPDWPIPLEEVELLLSRCPGRERETAGRSFEKGDQSGG